MRISQSLVYVSGLGRDLSALSYDQVETSGAASVIQMTLSSWTPFQYPEEPDSFVTIIRIGKFA